MSGREGKTYGLIIKKKPSSTPIKLSIFGNDSSSDEEEKGRKNVNNTIKKEAEKKKQTRQTQIEMAKVLEEDPTAYDYDQVYDAMAENKASLVAAKKATAEKKPKYIGNLLKFAEVRKKEEERRVERQVQKEREDEGNEFADKDAFVTSAYRRKIQEMAEDEEQQRRLDELEGDVTKQADLSMFYRNLLDKNLSTTGAHNSEDQSTTDETHRAADVESTSSRKVKNEGNKSSEKVERSKNDDKRKNVDEDDRGRKRNEERRRDHERRDTSDGRRRVSDKSERFREEDESQRRKPSPETHTKREEEKRLDEENTSPRESKRAEDGQGTSGDEGGQDEKKEQMEISGKIDANAEKQEFNEYKNDKRRNSDKDEKRELDSDLSIKGQAAVSKFAKHSSKETVLSARERYLARKNARVVVKATSEDEDE